MTASDLRDMFVTILAREAGGDRRRWRVTVGEVRIYSFATHAHCNWSVTPSGTIRDVARVENVADDLRLRYPIVTAG